MVSADADRVDAPESAPVATYQDDEKKSHYIKDEAGDLAVMAISAGEVDPAASKRVLQKIDFHILPFLCITYALQFIDKTALAYSSVYGIIKDTNLQGTQFSWCASIFYFGYLIFEAPGVVILQKFSVSKFLGVNIILWGGVLMTTAACSSFAGLATVRFILGMTEATISPGFVAVTGIWWSRTEQAGRSGLWVSFLGVGGCVGGLLAYAIGHISGSLPPWKYIFIILGAITVVWGVVFLLFVPDGPATARWLNAEDKVVAVQRVAKNQTGTGRSRTWDRVQIAEAITDPAVIILGLISFVNAIGSGGLTFGPLIVQGLGFSPINTILVQLPLSVIQTVAQLGSGIFTSKIAGSRLHVGSIAMIPAIIGTCLINNLHTDNKWGRLVGVWLVGTYPVGFLIILGLLSCNIAGSTKRSVANGWVFVCYCVGQIAGPQMFKGNEAPGYKSGIIAMLCAFCINLTLNQVLRMIYMRENKRRDNTLQGRTEQEVADLKRQGELQGFEDVTDKHNAMFRYALLRCSATGVEDR